MFYHKFEAIASWYGYDYQGVLACYYTIKQINKLINTKSDITEKIQIEDVKKIIKDYSVELEYMEDFAVKYKDEYNSFHQVKSGESIIKDEDVRDLYLKLLEYDDKGQHEIKGYFHVNEKDKIKNVKESLKSNLKIYFELLKSEMLELKDKETVDFRSKTKGKPIQILGDYMNESSIDKKNKHERDKCIDYLCAEINSIINKYFISNERFKEIFKNLIEYEETFDCIENIKKKIEEELTFFHSKVLESEYKINKEYLEKERCKIGTLIDENIDKRSKDDSFEKKISFEKFVDILDMDLNEWGTSNEYYEYKYKEKLYDFYKSYKKEYVEEECLKCNTDDCKLSKQLEKIEGLSKDQIKIFLDNISILKRNDYNDFPSKDAINQTIFSCMCENEKIGIEEKYNVGINVQSNDYWILATLADKDNTFLKQLFDEENNNTNILRDADILITKYIDIANIYDNKYYKVRKNEVDENLQDEKYNEVDNYNKIRVTAVKKWGNIKGELE